MNLGNLLDRVMPWVIAFVLLGAFVWQGQQHTTMPLMLFETLSRDIEDLQKVVNGLHADIDDKGLQYPPQLAGTR
jgi:hypothetical protein